MAESNALHIARALLQLAESIAPGVRGGAPAEAAARPTRNVDDAGTLADVIARALQGRENPPGGGGRAASIGDVLGSRTGATARPGRDPEGIAALIRALCPPTAPTTNADDVAALVRALCPIEPGATNLSEVAALIQALSPATGPAGRAGTEALIRALSPAQPGAQISAMADAFARPDLARILQALAPGEEQLRSALEAVTQTEGRGSVASLLPDPVPRQLQAIQVLRVLSPVAAFPRTSIKEAVGLLHSLSPAGDRPAAEVASVIAALSPAADKTVSSPDDAVNFISGLCPAGNLPAADVAEFVRALSPAADLEATETSNVAELIRALCPAGSEPTEVAALIRALSPADDPSSRVTEIAELIRQLSPADITPLDVLRTLSPASSE